MRRTARISIALTFGIAVVALCAAASEHSPSSPNRGERAVVAGRSHAGEVLDVDLPGSLHMKNINSRVPEPVTRDNPQGLGAGMCVMTSIEMAARWQGLDEYKGLRDWCAQQPGGGYPSKVDKQLAAFAREKNLPAPRYLQYQGPDVEPLVEAILRSGRMACVTYGYGERYGAGIAHMVCLVKYSGERATVLDNNFPGVEQYEWMSRPEAIRRVKLPRNVGWVFVWLAPPPPPSPMN